MTKWDVFSLNKKLIIDNTDITVVEITSRKVNNKTKRYAKCICKKDNYEWECCIDTLTKKHPNGCPMCAKNAKLTEQDIQNYISNINNEIQVVDFNNFKNSKDIIKVRCTTCKFEWYVRIGNLIYKKSGCPMCNNNSKCNDNNINWHGGSMEVECCVCGKKIKRNRAWIESIKYYTCSYECMGKMRSEKYTGENSSMWKGGVTEISEYLRHNIEEWKRDTRIKYNDKCDITQNKSEIVHHIYSFNKILAEIFESTGLSIHYNICDYTEEELKLLKKECLRLHYKYGLGVCLTNEIHEQFHSIYGYGNNTFEQYEEFKNYII